MNILLITTLSILVVSCFYNVHLIYAKTEGHDKENYFQIINNRDIDKFGITKLYDSKVGGFEWYMSMSNPQADNYLYNYDKMRKNSDSSYNIGNKSRLSVYSKDGIGYIEGSMDTYNFTHLSKKGYWYKPNDWKNVEITGEYNYRGGKGQGITHYVRSEDHSLLHIGCGGGQVIRTRSILMEQAISIKSKPIHTLGSPPT